MYCIKLNEIVQQRKNWPDTGHLTSIFSECLWPLLFQTNRIFRRINKLSENLTSLYKYLHFKNKTVSLKISHITLPFLRSTNLLRSKQRKYQPWKVYSPEQNGVLCDCFASFQIAKTFILKLSFEILRLPRTEKGASKIQFLFQVSRCWYHPDTGEHNVFLIFSGQKPCTRII